MKKFFIVSLCLVLCLSVFFFSVSASSFSQNDLSFNMAFAGTVGTGLGYLSSGYKSYANNETYTLISPQSFGTYTDDSFISSVVFIKNTDSTYIFSAGD